MYKRQVNHGAFDDKLQLSFNLANSFVKVDAVSDDVDKVGAVSYTHLDVYKRQHQNPNTTYQPS